ncbi:MAG: glutathione-disulfide reductase [Deltaproteobacteria bacterium]|nr:glutathione-disulfide reductase [Deltaproteobacteria bacterium]
MARYDYDLFTIGAGSGGVRASRVSAGLGARVAIAEERYLGGTCVNVGCIPKKLLVYASHYTEDFEDARAYGWTVGKSSFDWATLIRNKDREIARLNEVYRKLLDQSGVKRIEGRARIVDQNTVAIGDRTFSAKNILIATGSWPSVPEIPGIEHAITSNEAFHLKQLPRRVIVVGGGYIAVEFASIFHGLGAETTELYRGPLFLRGFDHDVRQVLAEEMRKKEIDLRFDLNIESIEQADDHLLATLSDGSKLEADQIMYATGRLPATSDLGLEEAGVELNQKGAVVVDEFSRSTVANIWAIGDVTDRINLTPVAIHEGMALAETLFHDRPTKPDHENVASAVFSQPQIGAVGLNETKARERYTELDIFRTRFRPLKHTLTGQDETTMMKLIVDRASGRVVGAHMVGPEAGEIIQGIAIAIKCRATKAEFDATIGLHPTSAEEFVTMRESVVN